MAAQTFSRACMLLLISVSAACVHRWFFEPHLEAAPPFVWSAEGYVELEEARRAFDMKAAVFLDVRPPQAYAHSHIPGALNLPIRELRARAGEVLGHLPKDVLIVTYCDGGSCQSSTTAARFLEQEGYVNVRAFYEGWMSWVSAGYPTSAGGVP